MMTKPITKLSVKVEKHKKHKLDVRLSDTIHYAQLYCKTCKKMIQWISKDQYNAIKYK